MPCETHKQNKIRNLKHLVNKGKRCLAGIDMLTKSSSSIRKP